MSKKYAEFEKSIADMINKFKGNSIPSNLPEWMISQDIVPGSTILKATDIGNKSSKNKTDVLMELENSSPIKISVKMKNADHMGNWYGHNRIIKEFGNNVFEKITKATTDWSNKIKYDSDWQNKPFVGVSILFGKRSGKTAVPFSEVFTNETERKEIILDIARGVGTGDKVANAFYNAEKEPSNINELFNNLEEINIQNIKTITKEFMISMRPINPMTEKSNRGKNVYSQFVLNKSLIPDNPKEIKTMSELNKIGTFKEVKPNSLNHNKILDYLKNNNVIIPRKK